MSKLQGPVEPRTLPFVGLSPRMRTSTWGDPGPAGFAGQAHAPFAPYAEQAQLGLNGLNLTNLRNRKSLLEGIDRGEPSAAQNSSRPRAHNRHRPKPKKCFTNPSAVYGLSSAATRF